jgi:uncharacterized protein YbaR (Trm112 family)
MWRSRLPNNLEELEKMLVCPVCRSNVRRVERKFWCVNDECRRSYPIDEYDIPHMLQEEASIEMTAALQSSPPAPASGTPGDAGDRTESPAVGAGPNG